MAAGFALALHFGTWITSLAYTSIAASTALVTTNPVWVVLVSWFLGETPQLATVIGVAIALSGGLLIGLGSESSGVAASQPLLGNALALMGAWGASAYFLLGRAAQQRRLSIQAYATIAYTTAAIVLLPLPLLFNTPYTGHAPVVYACLLIMALVPQLIGHTSLNWAVRWVSPTVVTLVILFEPVLSSLLGYLMFREAPGMAVLLGSAVLLLGVAMTVRSLSPNGNN
jgi:drug/metabolite transporter (DMT)-like permease